MRVVLVVIPFFFALACNKAPPFQGELRLGDSATRSLIAAKEEDDIACEAPEFNDQVCLSYNDFVDEFMIRFQCDRWKRGTHLVDARTIVVPNVPGLKEKVEDFIERESNGRL